MILDYFRQHPLVGAGIAVLFIAVIFLWAKVLKDRGAHNAETEAILKRLKEENKLRSDFVNLTKELADSSDTVSLFRGVSLNLQKRISDSVDMEKEFSLLTDEQRMIYALGFVVEDGGEKLSGFFAENGKPLTDEAKKAVEAMLPEDAAEIFSKEYFAYDPDDETTSLIADEIEKSDETFSKIVSADEIMKSGGEFIRKNIEKMV